MKARLLILLLTFIFSVIPSHSQSLCLRHRNGKATVVALSEAPIVRTAEDGISITSAGGTKTFDKDDVLSIVFQSSQEDVNRDYNVDISDVVSVINTIAGSNAYQASSDVNGDKKTDISDIVAIINSIAGKSETSQIPSFEPDHSSAIGEAIYIYRNDGEFNAFLRYEVEQITFEVGNSLIQTADSIYSIPLFAIDSLSFIQPKTVYKDETVQLSGQMLEYVSCVEDMNLTFSSQTPLSLLPNVGDKIATLDFTELFPGGFTGVVSSVTATDEGFKVSCDYVALEEVVNRFYGVVELVKGDDDESVEDELMENVKARAQSRSASSQKQSNYFKIDIPHIHQPHDLSYFITKTKIGDFSPKAEINVYIKPFIKGRMSRVVDSFIALSYMEMHAVMDVQTRTGIAIAGELSKCYDKPFYENDKLKGPWGIPLYLSFGPKIEGNANIAIGSTLYLDFLHTLDIKYYPVTNVFPISGFLNSMSQHTLLQRFDIDIPYVVASGSVKIGFDIKFGIPFGSKKIGWVGGEINPGAKMEFDFMFDFEQLHNADKGTGFYNDVKNSTVSIMPYIGAHLVASFADDSLHWKLGRDYSILGAKIYDGYVLPHFDNVSFNLKKDNQRSAIVSANVSEGGLFPFSIGFSILDDKGNLVCGPVYYEREYKNKAELPLYHIEFDKLSPGKNYYAFPVIKLFNHDVLASPSAELATEFPVEIKSFEVMKSQYKKDAFLNDEKHYSYQYDVATTVECISEEGLSDWGYVYEDSLGKKAYISLKSFGSPYTDTRYAYFRNVPVSSARLYGYVKYEGDDKYYYGEPHDYDLICEEPSLCPDSNHPHAIDLGIGVKWSCCNVGASAPWEDGGYYAWGETEEKNTYSNDTYAYFGVGKCNSIGSDIAGTKYDVAHTKWGNGWCMPNQSQMEILNSKCTNEWTTINGVNGRKYTGPNGASIFLPASGDKLYNDVYDVDNYGYYWSSTQVSDVVDYAHDIYFHKDNSFVDYSHRSYGRSVRPVMQ